MKSDTRYGPPKIIKLKHDSYITKHMGRRENKEQFFLTRPFIPARPGLDGNEFVALYLFNEQGALIEAKIDRLGPRSGLNDQTKDDIYNQRLHELGSVSFMDINIAPFSVEKFGIKFGLIPRRPTNKEDSWSVRAEPGNYMAVYEPWDDGRYDT